MKTKRLLKKGSLLLALLAFILVGCGGNDTASVAGYDLEAYKENAIAILTAYVQALNPDDYSDENWAEIEMIANTGKKNIDMATSKQGVDSALAEAKCEIGWIERKHIDFIMTISVNHTTFKQGSHITVDFRLKNISEKNHHIKFAYNWSFWPMISGRDMDLHEVRTYYPNQPSRLFNAGSEMGSAWTLRICKEPGMYEIRFATAFYVNLDQGNRQMIRVRSDPVKLTVTENNIILTISAEETTLRRGENFVVNVELKNNSEEDYVIFYDSLFDPFIPNWHLRDEWSLPFPPWNAFNMSSPFEAGSILQNIRTWGHSGGPWIFGTTLARGTHELRFSARFRLNQRSGLLIEVWSNPIILTVR